jgi:2-keto-4-pentenoate hydratase/2-oxohepta-3-ene-1,7-dioic acid hydratase in catechol pathway
MKIVHTLEFDLGVVRGDEVIDVTSLFDGIPYRSSLDRVPKLIGALSERRDDVANFVANAPGGPALSDVTILAPVPRPPKLIACLRNYYEGVDRERETQDMFLESPDSVIGTGGTVILPSHEATIFHHEAELAVVIGKRAKDLPADESALDAIAGYTMAIDVSGRGIGRMGPSRMGKSFNTFTPLGPMILTPDEVPDPQNLQVTLGANSAIRQTYSTSDMEYSVVEVLHFISGYMTLIPGDVLMLGTNHQGLGPMQNGDNVVMSIDGFGSLEVSVVDEQQRSWPVGVDEEMAARMRGENA